MNDRELADDIASDLLRAPAGKVLYLEGRTDVPIFFSLLGLAPPVGGVLHGVFVRGLQEKVGAGSSAVRRRIEVARRENLPGILGVIDGDGKDAATLAGSFDAPFKGPLYTWKVYCIENLLVKTGLPPQWGAAPDWTDIFRRYAGYVALNRIHVRLRVALKTLGLSRFSHPVPNEPLLTVAEIAAALEKDKHLISGFDVAKEFAAEAEAFERLAETSLDEAHAHLDGKFIVRAFASTHSGQTTDACRDIWTSHAISVGGLPEVRDLWQRITGVAA